MDHQTFHEHLHWLKRHAGHGLVSIEKRSFDSVLDALIKAHVDVGSYKDLLIKYIEHVRCEEGVDFVDRARTTGDVPFTEAQLAELKKLAGARVEAINMLPLGPQSFVAKWSDYGIHNVDNWASLPLEQTERRFRVTVATVPHQVFAYDVPAHLIDEFTCNAGPGITWSVDSRYLTWTEYAIINTDLNRGHGLQPPKHIEDRCKVAEGDRALGLAVQSNGFISGNPDCKAVVKVDNGTTSAEFVVDTSTAEKILGIDWDKEAAAALAEDFSFDKWFKSHGTPVADLTTGFTAGEGLREVNLRSCAARQEAVEAYNAAISKFKEAWKSYAYTSSREFGDLKPDHIRARLVVPRPGHSPDITIYDFPESRQPVFYNDAHTLWLATGLVVHPVTVIPK